MSGSALSLSFHIRMNERCALTYPLRSALPIPPFPVVLMTPTDSALHRKKDWMYPKKVDKCVRIRDKKKQKGKTHMPNKNSPTKYSEEFKKTIVTLYQSGKTYAEIKKEYGVSSSALSNWVRKYSQVQVDEDTVLTAQQIKALQRRNAELEEENLILKKAIAIFTPHSDRD